MKFGPFEFTNNVSGVVLGALLIVVAGIVWLLREIYKTRGQAESAHEAAGQAATTLSGSITHTLDMIAQQNSLNAKALDEVQAQLNEHLLWHMNERKRR